MKPRRRKRIVRLFVAAAVLAVLYVGSYVVLAVRGGYYWSQSGKTRYVSGMSASDVEIWQPDVAWWEPFRDIHGNDTSRGNLLGFVYSPLIRLDRHWFHPTHELFGDEPTTSPSR
jgi:hypothetical protein